MHRLTPLAFLLIAAPVAVAGCAERDRVRFDCGGIIVAISTQQRMPGWAGGEERVFVEVRAADGAAVRAEIDNNGRWIEQLGASVAADASWIRFHVSDPRGEDAGRYRFSTVAFVAPREGTLIRSTVADSTDEERASLFAPAATLAATQTIRGREIAWRPCTVAGGSR